MRITKKVVEIGNGAAVYVPKEYTGQEIIVILPESIEQIKNLVLNKLMKFMSNIVGIYLYGSYARHEQRKDSDIDILVITKEDDINIKNALKDIDARVVTLNNIKNALQRYPLFILPILKEAIPILNSLLLEELKQVKININKFKWNFDEIKRIIEIIEKFIEIDEQNIAPSHVYSLLLRIRTCHLIECLINNKKFYNENVSKLLLNYGFKKETINKFFYIYNIIKENEETKIKIKKEEILKLISFLKVYLKKVEDETKKATQKRH